MTLEDEMLFVKFATTLMMTTFAESKSKMNYQTVLENWFLPKQASQASKQLTYHLKKLISNIKTC